MQDLGERTWDFSWGRQKSQNAGNSQMRWRDRESGEEWFVLEMVPGNGTKEFNAYLLGEGEQDHLLIRTRLVLSDDGSAVYLFAPEEVPELGHANDPCDMNLALPDSHYRICARLSENDMRCRDERTGELRHVTGFFGPASLNWLDHGTHIFHDGKVEVCSMNWAHTIIDTEKGSHFRIVPAEEPVSV